MAEQILVGAHFRRYFGGPGRLHIEPGRLRLVDRRGRRSVQHAGDVVQLARKRWEPPGTNHWLTVDDGVATAWATMSRRRADRVAAALEGAGFVVERT